MEKIKKLSPNKRWMNFNDSFMENLHDDWVGYLQQIKSEFYFASVDFFKKKKMVFPFLPMTTGAISSPFGIGSDSKPVPVNIMGEETYLADSMQFYLEYALRAYQKGTFYIMPSFRGEDADERHLCQFYHVESEIVGTINDVMTLVEEYLFYVTTYLLNECKEILDLFIEDDEHIKDFLRLKTQGIPKVKFKDAVVILQGNKKFVDYSILNGEEIIKITNLGEQELIRLNRGAVWLTEMPINLVPFYQENVDDKYSTQADLLMGIGEIVGSGQRHSDKIDVLNALKRRSVRSDEYDWYIRMKDEYPLTTSGFGLGMERYFLWLLNHDDIRDIQMIPRFNGVKVIP